MIFNSKQLEELENINDSTGAFEEEGDDESGFDEVGEAAMDWRRSLIEEAAENIKRAKGRPVESGLTYPIGSMLFEREARRFARVQRSIPGYLKIVYLSGGDREFGTLDVPSYLKDYGSEKRLSELAEQLGMADVDVANELERLGITPVEEPDAEVVEGAEGAEVEAEAEDVVEEEVPVVAKGKKGEAKVAKAPAKAPPPAKPEPAAKAAKPAKAAKAEPEVKNSKADNARAARAQKAEKPEKSDAKKGAKGGKTINPIDDPNGYIKANFQEMSNRELARFTGLSEHTIRRKLGEWGLKRKQA
jgi:hypothetical protein